MTDNSIPSDKKGQETMVEGSCLQPSAVVIYATFPDRAAALSCGQQLVSERLAGCINILDGMTSVYVWEGKTETSQEAVMIAKLPAGGAAKCRARIKELHEYDTPAILVLPVIDGEEGYLAWLEEGTD